ncbi:SHOCT domain-containing protein [Glycomyces buryatensis]|uniref:SHOCT domain-containing protein n=1 Tax=Glycomyces buryatensis TaxID=2570927 RepID=A0A4S8QQ11_9ACTN|nr:SHOCT domain-containing protein [Glycomyces buryatensis]THV42804.1 SHOCT domain-containing protein [Glycomyces buryatensis]
MMRRRVGRPGLIGTMARTAVIAGTAGAVNRSMNKAANNRAQTQAEAEAYRAQQSTPAQPVPPAPPPAPTAPVSSGDDVISKLKQLGELHAAGILSDEEFGAAKAKLLA